MYGYDGSLNEAYKKVKPTKPKIDTRSWWSRVHADLTIYYYNISNGGEATGPIKYCS